MIPNELDSLLNTDDAFTCIKCMNNIGSLVSLDFERGSDVFSALVYLAHWEVSKSGTSICTSDRNTNQICEILTGKKLLCAKYAAKRLVLEFEMDINFSISPALEFDYESGSEGDDLVDFFIEQIGKSISLNSLRGWFSEDL